MQTNRWICFNLTICVGPEAALYDTKDDFTCLDGSLKVPFRYVNDDYCDCPDGSDEPGTSACPNGSYFCENKGHTSLLVPSSRVNDGICDCCDGSDEYASGVSCKNLCAQFARAAKEEAERLQQMQKDALVVKQKYIQQGKNARAAGKARLAVLLADKISAEAFKAKLEEEKNLAEEREKLALEEHLRTAGDKQNGNEHLRDQKHDKEALMYFESLDTDKDGKLQLHEVQTVLAFDFDKDGTVTKSETQFFFQGNEELDQEQFLTSGWPAVRTLLMNEARRSHAELGKLREDPEAAKQDGTKKQQKFDPETQTIVDNATKARNAYDAASQRLLEIEQEVEDLTIKQERDYGQQDEFQPLEGQCFEYTDREYTYKLCPFNYVSQSPKDGGSETRLGVWSSWNGPSENKYSTMLFDSGDQCWNGPQRSAKVTLSCGVENALTAVSEPSRCEYAMKFSTPAACEDPGMESSGKIFHSHEEL